jgi:hypothetical protein
LRGRLYVLETGTAEAVEPEVTAVEPEVTAVEANIAAVVADFHAVMADVAAIGEWCLGLGSNSGEEEANRE